jgi:hypothetical protein
LNKLVGLVGLVGVVGILGLFWLDFGMDHFKWVWELIF